MMNCKALGGSDDEPHWGTSPALDWSDCGKPQTIWVRKAVLRADFRTETSLI